MVDEEDLGHSGPHLDPRPARRTDLAWRQIDGCVVIVDPRDSKLHDLSEVASFYWELMDGSRSVDDLVGAAVEEFDVDAPTARTDLEAHLAELSALGLLESPGEGGG